MDQIKRVFADKYAPFFTTMKDSLGYSYATDPPYKIFEAGYKEGAKSKEEQLKCCGACKWWLCMSMACAHSEPILQHAKVSDYCEYFEPREK